MNFSLLQLNISIQKYIVILMEWMDKWKKKSFEKKQIKTIYASTKILKSYN